MNKIWSYWLLTYAELIYWLVGTSPEGYHLSKANAWSRIDNHRNAIKHLRSYLKYSDKPSMRWHLAYHLGCVGELPEAAEQYAKAAAALNQPVVRIGYAQAVLRLGDRHKAREIIGTLDRDHPQLEERLQTMRDELLHECAGEDAAR